MSNSESEENSIKIVLVGESGVGKTSIIERYIYESFDNSTESTLAAGFSRKELKFPELNISLSLDLWDTAGQEIYRAIAKTYYKNAAIAILVYDITRKDSFDEMCNYWYKQIKESGEKDVIFGIAGNKCDMFVEQKISEKEGKEFADKIGAVFSLCSAKGSIGINDLFLGVTKKYIEKVGVENIKNESKGEKLTRKVVKKKSCSC